MSEIATIFLSNDNLIELANLQNEVTGAYINDATVNVTLVNSTGTNVVGTTWPKVMPYVAASDGLYRATLGYDLVLTANSRYTANIVVVSGALRASWAADVVCKTRK